MRRLSLLALVAATLAAVAALSAPSHAGPKGRFAHRAGPKVPPLSGPADYRLLHATGPVPRDAAVAESAGGTDDIQVNGDNKRNPGARFGSGEGFPQNETTIAINPRDPSNVIGGANDYEYGVDSLGGVYTSFDGGHRWSYSSHIPTVITPDRDWLGSGDPAIAFDTLGVAYYATINFARSTCDSWIAVSRSVNRGVNWTVPVGSESDGTGLTVGDGIVAHNGGDEDCQFFHDKEYIAAGPRPEGTRLVPGTDRRYLSSDRVYVTWTKFDFGPGGTGYVESPIVVSYSDDQGRHWSEAQVISGSADFCLGGVCNSDQFSVPVVYNETGEVFVAFENFNTVAENQYLVVRSSDGGVTWDGPYRVGTVFDINYPTCPVTGSATLDDMCARISATGNIDVDQGTGDLYLTWSDNRNGSMGDTNNDVIVVKSTDGGVTWSDAVNVTEESETDQFYPWLSVTPRGDVAVAYFDRRYDPGQKVATSLSVSTDGGLSFSTRQVSEVPFDPDLTFRLGIFIGDYNGLDTTAQTALPFWTDGRFGEPPIEGNNPPGPQSDVMVDVEGL